MNANQPFRPTRLSATHAWAAVPALCALMATHQAAARPYYVNDGSTTNDIFCTARGLDSNSGLSPAAPVASLGTLLGRYTLTAATDVVYIDAGSYVSTANIVIDSRHGGTWDNRLTFMGAGRATVLNRNSQSAGACCLVNRANYVTLSNLTFTGAEVGLSIDSSFCSDATVAGNTFFGNIKAGLSVQPSTNAFYGQFMISHNLLYNNRDGLVLEPQTDMQGSEFKLFNNTIIVTNGTAVTLGGRISYSEARNNIVVAKGGTCFAALTGDSIFQSDYNDLWAPDGGAIAKVAYNGSTNVFASLDDWQRYTHAAFYSARDAHSFSRDPAFAEPAGADVHLKSSCGRWLPDANNGTGGVWVVDEQLHSPCIDAADPYALTELLGNEPVPNGARLNIGCHGGTREASMTFTGRALLAMAPDEGQDPLLMQLIYWNATGDGWNVNDTVKVEYSLDGGASWEALTNSTPTYAVNGMLEWLRPLATFGSPSGCWVRVTSLADVSVTDAVFLKNTYTPPGPSELYVNDASSDGDLWCSAAGSDANDGLSPSTPVASLQAVLDRYTLGPSCTVFVDAGTYELASNIVIEARHSGDANARFSIKGAGRATVLRRQSHSAGDCCLHVCANYIRLENLTFTDADTGLSIDSSFCANASVIGNTFFGNSGVALRVEPSANSAYGSIEVRHNLLYDNADGMSLNAHITDMSASFMVVNNTLVVTNGFGLLMGGYYMGSLVRNNIIVADGNAACLGSLSGANNFASDYNNLWTRNGGTVARITVAVGAETNLTALAQWQRFTQKHYGMSRDAHSFSRDPLFVSPVNQDYHASSLGGSWHGEAWTTDAFQSPCIDAGDPFNEWDSLAFESAPNGGRVNLGAFGGTPQASRASTGRHLLTMAPDQGQSPQSTQFIYWNATGEGWGTNDAVKLEYSLDGGSQWQWIANAAFASSSGSFGWVRPPDSLNSPSGCWVRASCLQNNAIRDEAFLENTYVPPPTVFYVNDGSRVGDLWCGAAGHYAHDGLSSNTPLDTIQSVIDRYTPGIGSTIYVDAGTYLLYSDLYLPNTGAGGGPSNNWFRLIGADRRTILSRQYAYSGSCCIRVNQDFARIDGFVCRGAESGLIIDPSTCRNASIAHNTFTGNSGFGIRVLSDTINDGFDTYEIRNNLVYNNGGGLSLQASTGFHLASFTVENNTVEVFNGTGIACGGRWRGTTLRNNIVVTKGSGTCLSVDATNVLASSEYNNLYPYGGASAARWMTNNAYRTALTLLAWQNASALDTSSMSRDPLFVSPSSGDYHLRSLGGSWHNGAWAADTATSPCIDAGKTTSAYGNEPVPNGSRINLGAYGNTREASRSAPNRKLTLLTPRGGEMWSGLLTIAWNASGSGWNSNDTCRIEYSANGGAWTALATTLPPTGSFSWSVPNPTTATATYFLRVVCNQDASVSDATTSAGLVTRISATYYVNDSLTNSDWYCTAPGAANNAGDAPSRPLASLSDVFSRYLLRPGDTVYVDTGTFSLPSTIVINATHKGASDAPIRVIGTRGGTILNRQTGDGNRRCLEIHSDFLSVEGLTCAAADIGISVNASSARHVSLVGNICRNNTLLGIEIRPYGAFSGEEYQILQNVVCNNGAGLALESAATASNCLFVIENNTVYNGGTGIKILNAKTGRNKNILRNNIVETTNAQSACLVAFPGSLHYSDFNNLYPRSGGHVGAWTNTASITPFATLAHWRTANGQDKNSLSTDSLFVSLGNNNLRLHANSPCVDAGVISFWMFDTTDADGNPRIASKTADIGAYELNVRSSLRLYLQGALLSGSSLMSAALSQSGVLPLQSPYADDPRTASRIPSNTTDWVLVQFRHATNGPAFLSRSMFLRSDGWLVSDAGSTNLAADLPPNSAFYVVVKHRNHVAAMSAVPVAFTNQALSYDFTTNASAYFGGSNGCSVVSNGNAAFCALRSGDIDGDGTVLPIDQSIRASLTNSTACYRRADANLDGMVTSDDDDRIQMNLSASSPIPRPETVLSSALPLNPSRKTLTVGEAVMLSGGAGIGTAAYSSGYGMDTTAPLNWGYVQNGSGATLASYGGSLAYHTAGTQTGRTDIVEAWDSSDALGRATLNVIGAQTLALAGKALVIAGRTSAEDTLWPTTDYLADNAYTTLRYRGFSAENIHYLSPELSQDTDGLSTLANAADALTTVVTNTDSLFIYLVDHGGNSSGNGYFRLSGSETITAAQLGDWLDALQDAHGTRVTVLLDFCYAGSFLHELAYAGAAPRIVIAACGTNQPSYFVAGGLVSFSGAFFSGVMLGYDVMQCFTMAQSAMSTYQAALLDDDKDGIYSTNDWSQATGTYIGPTFVASGDAPQIGEVCGNQVLADETAATLWIGSVTSPHPVSRAWCLIVPPGHDPDPDNPVTDLPQLELAYSGDNGHYSVTYDGFTTPGTYNVSFYVQDEEGNVSAPRSSFIAQIGYDDRVILVAGGDTNSPAWPAIDALTRLAYSTLRLRLFTPDHIRVLSPTGFADLDGDGSNDVAAASGLASLQAALSEWALTNATDRLTLYLIGEGALNTLRLSNSDTLTTNALATWVHDFQAANPVPVNIILDFSGAGAFLPALAAPQLALDSPAATRIAIASARAGREALFANGGTVSFSQYLLSGVISGRTLGDAYTDARRAIRRVSGSVRQQAQLDDNLNGEPNEKDIDGLLADETYLGSAFVTGADAPVIGAVTPLTVLAAPGAPVTLWASEIAGMYPVSNVWCLVTPPGYSGTNDLPAIALVWDALSARYVSASADFTLPGSYGLTFIAEDSTGERSDPVQSEVILADAYEPDDTLSDASLYNGPAQLHTFLTAADEDWVRFFLVTNFIYDIETYHLSTSLDTVIDLYRELSDGTLEALDHIDEEGHESGEYTGLDYPSSGWYWARITPYSAGTNTVGAYEFSVDIPAADGLCTLIVLGVDGVYSSALPTGTTVTVDGRGTKPFSGSKTVTYTGLTNGSYLVTLPVPGNFMPREDPNTPFQVQSLTNIYYANPRRVAISGSWSLAGFELLSSVAVTSGVVRDAWTHAFLGNAQIAFTAASGSLTGVVVDGSVILTSYRTNWLSSADGRLPPNITLGSCNWNLSVALTGYQTYTRPGAVSNLQTGARMNLGTAYLVPTDTNANEVSDAWEALYFPGGMSPGADSDGDGLDNRSEYLSGTDPTNALSVLRFLGAQTGTNAASLTWSVTSGRSYQILSVTSLVAFATLQTNGPWEATHDQTTMVWADTNAPLHKTRFYRVRLNNP